MASDDPKRGFYIETDCCLLCGVPEEIAPDLFVTGDQHCYVLRQPATDQETYLVLEAVMSSEVDCIRYGGSDKAILRRMGEAGLAAQADDPDISRCATVHRNHVRFRPAVPVKLAGLARRFADFLRAQPGFQGGPRYEVRNLLPLTRSVSFAWFERSFHTVTFETDGDPTWLAASLKPDHGSALHGLARIVDGWLKKDMSCRDVDWLSQQQRWAHQPGTATPY